MKRMLCTLLLALVAWPVAARSDNWVLRLQAIAVDPPDGLSFTVFETSVDVDYDTGLGMAASLEYRFTKRLGLDLAAYFVEHDVSVSAEGPGSALAVGTGIELAPSTLGLVYHATPGQKVDVYVLAGVGIVLDQSGPQQFSDQIVAGGLGVDVAIGEGRWAVSSSLRFIEGSAANNYDLGPMWAFGFAQRF